MLLVSLRPKKRSSVTVVSKCLLHLFISLSICSVCVIACVFFKFLLVFLYVFAFFCLFLEFACLFLFVCLFLFFHICFL